MGSSHSTTTLQRPTRSPATATTHECLTTTTTPTTIPRVFATSASLCVSSPIQQDAFVYFEDSRPGDATPLIAICLPGIGDTRRQFRLLAPMLHEQLGCRVLLGDLRGFGDSADFVSLKTGNQTHAAYSPEAVAADVVQLMDALHAQHPASEFLLIGNSLSAGAMVLAAMDAAAAASRAMSVKTLPTVRAVVLLGPILRDAAVDRWFRPLSHVLFRELYGASVWLQYYQTLYPSARPADFDYELALLGAHMRAKRSNVVNIGRFARASKRGVADAVVAFGALEAHGAAVASSTPHMPPPAVLAVYGRKDPDFADFDAELAWFQRAVPRATCVTFADGGHYPHLEHPQRVADAIATLLQGSSD